MGLPMASACLLTAADSLLSACPMFEDDAAVASLTFLKINYRFLKGDLIQTELDFGCIFHFFFFFNHSYGKRAVLGSKKGS